MVAKKTKDELKSKDLDQLKEQLAKKKRELMNFRFQKVAGTLGGTHKFSLLRREIACINTIMSNRMASS